MKTIVTASGAYRTGTEIADAVTAYGLALARARELDIVDIPFVGPDGALNRVQFRIGWLIETAVTTDLRPAEEVIEIDTTLDLLDRTRFVSRAQRQNTNPRQPGVRGESSWDEII